MNIAIYSLTSQLHDEKAVDEVTTAFLNTIDLPFDFLGNDYSDYGNRPLSLIFVRTGGTEGIFKRLLPELKAKTRQPFYLLTSGKSNSLAASMEILSFLRQQGIKGEIIHGDPAYVNRRIGVLSKVNEARRTLQGKRLGIIGQPSDWLISSKFDAEKIKNVLGVELEEIPMEELLTAIGRLPLTTVPSDRDAPSCVRESMPGARRIEEALRLLVADRHLDGLTLRCFDLLTAVKNTGCLALAHLNGEGIVASCEGDVPAMLSMTIAQALTGMTGFQANPSTIDPEKGELLFAHCTIPFNMVHSFDYDTHFESGIGVGIRGKMPEGPVTIFKMAGDLSRCFIAEAELMRNQAEPDLCRTQVIIRLDDPSQTRYFLSNPIGNHHIIIPGHHAELLDMFLSI